MFMPNPIFAPDSAAKAGQGLQTVLIAGLVTPVQCNLPGAGNAVRITNRGAGDAFVVPQGNAALNLPQACIPVAGVPGGWIVMANTSTEQQLPQGTQALSFVCSANATLYVTRGQS
jgi:hypothetical protein